MPEYKEIDYAHTPEALACFENIKNKVAESPHASGLVVVAMGGSIAYGLATPNSDVDLRGAFRPAVRDLLMIRDYEQIEIHAGDDDTVLYSPAKLCRLLIANNPNVIELLGLRRDHILASSDFFETLLDNRLLFVSARCAHTFGGYGAQQLRRIQNSLSRDGNSKMDADGAKRSMDAAISAFGTRYDAFEANPGNKVFARIADPSAGAKGILIDMALTGIPVNELKAMNRDLDDIAKNADNLAARNRKKDTAHLAKHMSHLIRLIRMGTEMLETGEVNTYREEDRELLLAIKNGLWLHEDEDGVRSVDDEFWELLSEEEAKFKQAEKTTDLPPAADTGAVNELLMDYHCTIIEDHLAFK